MKERVNRLELVLGHTFANRELAMEAITHSSARGEHGHRDVPTNRRLAYLGDAVLELAVRHHQMNSGNAPGLLTDSKQKVVSNEALGALALRLGFDEILVRSRGHAEPHHEEKLWEESLEAAIGAVFLDAGYERAARVVKRILRS